jgi:hypothetical protein
MPESVCGRVGRGMWSDLCVSVCGRVARGMWSDLCVSVCGRVARGMWSDLCVSVCGRVARGMWSDLCVSVCGCVTRGIWSVLCAHVWAHVRVFTCVLERVYEWMCGVCVLRCLWAGVRGYFCMCVCLREYATQSFLCTKSSFGANTAPSSQEIPHLFWITNNRILFSKARHSYLILIFWYTNETSHLWMCEC